MYLSILAQGLGWLSLWAFWVGISRHNHPNLTLNACASALLVLTFAVAVYINHLRFLPRLWSKGRIAGYAAALLATLVVLALGCTAAIHVLYEWLWGPDPARFGFWMNFGMEFVLVVGHVAVVAGGVWLIGRTRRVRGTTRMPGAS